MLYLQTLLHTFGVMVKISNVRSVASLRSKSVMGIARVCVDARLRDVASDSRDERSLYNIRECELKSVEQLTQLMRCHDWS